MLDSGPKHTIIKQSIVGFMRHEKRQILVRGRGKLTMTGLHYIVSYLEKYYSIDYCDIALYHIDNICYS